MVLEIILISAASSLVVSGIIELIRYLKKKSKCKIKIDIGDKTKTQLK